MKKARLYKKETLMEYVGFKQANVEIGKWYKFDVINIGEELVGYGKVVNIDDAENGFVEVENYFELPSYRPFASRKWFDNLPHAELIVGGLPRHDDK